MVLTIHYYLNGGRTLIANELLQETETVLDDGRTVYTALVDMKLHDEVWGLYANLKSGEGEDAVNGVLDIISRVEQYPAIDARYVELADAYDIFRDALSAIHNDDFGADWDYVAIDDPYGDGNLDDDAFLSVISEGIRLIGKRLNMDSGTVESDISLWD